METPIGVSGLRSVAPRGVARAVRHSAHALAGRARLELVWLASRRGRANVALFHEFESAPSGGGHQFLRALLAELDRRDLEVELNRLSAGTPACLFNSFNFDFGRLRRFAREGVKMVHRVDGPIGVYRGFDDGTDARIADVNRRFAETTIFQSRYSLEKHQQLGLDLTSPIVVMNTVDPSIFSPSQEREPLSGRKIRIVATSWSENPRKGAATLDWLDRYLDWDRYELTFVGQASRRFERIRAVGPFDSEGVARALRHNDIYLAASRDDPCSNALLEALACGLPAAYLDSGGHPELVGGAGLPFRSNEELPDVLAQLVDGYEAFRAVIAVPPIADVADRYLDILGIART